MKNWTFILLAGIICLCSCTQNFEGIISYETTYESKVQGVSAGELFGQKNSKDTTYFKEGVYLHKVNADQMHYLLWRSVDTMQYFKNRSSQDTIWFDKTNSHPSFIDSTRIEKNADTVAGYECDKLIVYRENRVYTYFYNSDFKLDPHHYREFSNSAKYEVMKLMKSPTLRLKVSSTTGVMDMIAVNVDVTSLPDSIFKVPDGTLVKSKY
ncbi:MAG: hypothetical protein ACQERC_10700 [Bacteroidota bacterium]